MRKTKHGGGFLICLLFNILLNPEGLFPAAVLLFMHFAVGWPLRWPLIALGAWIVWIIIRTAIISWANRCGNTPDPPRENKNPYSVKKDR